MFINKKGTHRYVYLNILMSTILIQYLESVWTKARDFDT